MFTLRPLIEHHYPHIKYEAGSSHSPLSKIPNSCRDGVKKVEKTEATAPSTEETTDTETTEKTKSLEM